jgi:hypothetical protein
VVGPKQRVLATRQLLAGGASSAYAETPKVLNPPKVVRRRFVAQQLRNLVPILSFPLFVISIMRPNGLEPIQALVIFGGSLPVWLLAGFLISRRIGRKCDPSGVYRPGAPSFTLIVSFVIGIAALLLVLFFVTVLSPMISLSLLTGAEAAFVGGGLAAPLGTIIFERKARSRLWILRTASPWWPRTTEFHLEWAG